MEKQKLTSIDENYVKKFCKIFYIFVTIDIIMKINANLLNMNKK